MNFIELCYGKLLSSSFNHLKNRHPIPTDGFVTLKMEVALPRNLLKVVNYSLRFLLQVDTFEFCEIKKMQMTVKLCS